MLQQRRLIELKRSPVAASVPVLSKRLWVSGRVQGEVFRVLRVQLSNIRMTPVQLEQIYRAVDSERLTDYLRTAPGRGLSTQAAADAAEQLWLSLRQNIEQIQLPNATPTDESGLLLSWTNRPSYLEIEITPGGRYEWFFLNAESRISDGGEDLPVEVIAPELQSHIRDLIENDFAPAANVRNRFQAR